MYVKELVQVSTSWMIAVIASVYKINADEFFHCHSLTQLQTLAHALCLGCRLFAYQNSVYFLSLRWVTTFALKHSLICHILSFPLISQHLFALLSITPLTLCKSTSLCVHVFLPTRGLIHPYVFISFPASTWTSRFSPNTWLWHSDEGLHKRTGGCPLRLHSAVYLRNLSQLLNQMGFYFSHRESHEGGSRAAVQGCL